MDNDALNVCVEHIKPEDFYKEAHKIVFRSMMELSDRSDPVDLVTIGGYLSDKSLLDQVGGAAYLSYLVDGVPVASNVESYAKLVREKSLVRSLIAASTEIVTDCYNEPGNVSELIDRAESRLFAVSGQREKKGFAAAKDLVYEGYKLIEKLYERQSHLTGLATGFKDMDEMTGGLQKGDLFIIAGRPSMGKTAFALNLAVNAARFSNATVAVYSLEMGKEQLMMRMMTSEARIDAGRIRKGELHDDDWPKLTKAADLLSQQKIFIDDQPAQSTFEIRAKARRLAKEHGLDLVIIDYLQLIRGSGSTYSREQEISEISRSLKALAKEMQVPVIALSQLNRSVETRDDKRPRMSDLRESGAIEQDADVISFVYRDVVYHPDTPDQNVAEIIVGKHRNGAIGKVRLAFLNEYTRFEDLVYDAYAGGPPGASGFGPGQDDGPF
jgi:replicative DNA helicase